MRGCCSSWRCCWRRRYLCAWNNTGHMVAARLAWKRLTEAQRAEAVKILKDHPHYDEFLAAERPQAPEGYARDAGRVARIQVGKAGRRLAQLLGRILTR